MSEAFKVSKLYVRSRWMYEFWATGTGRFPYAMLKYDRCWPVEEESANLIGVTYEDGRLFRYPRSIQLHSHNEPNSARWFKYNWTLSAEKPTEMLRSVV